MKKLLIILVMVLIPIMGNAYNFNDPGNDANSPIYESYGINVLNWTPGVNSGPIQFELFTNYKQSAVPFSYPADLFLVMKSFGIEYWRAIPLSDRYGFVPGYMYDLFSWETDYLTHSIPVAMTIGSFFKTGDIPKWTAIFPQPPNYRVDLSVDFWEPDPLGSLWFLWGTADCGNDTIIGEIPPTAVPEPATLFLVGVGLLGVARLKRR